MSVLDRTRTIQNVLERYGFNVPSGVSFCSVPFLNLQLERYFEPKRLKERSEIVQEQSFTTDLGCRQKFSMFFSFCAGGAGLLNSYDLMSWAI